MRTYEQEEAFCRLVEEIQEQEDAVGIAVAIVEASGEIVYERYFGYGDREQKLPMNKDTLFGVASVTKSFTAMGIAQLVEQKRIQYDGLVSQYLSTFRPVY